MNLNRFNGLASFASMIVANRPSPRRSNWDLLRCSAKPMNLRRLCGSLLLVLLLGGCGSRPDYLAPPFFSETAFREVRPGMDESGVRALLGFPLSRFGPVEVPGQTRKLVWHYAVPRSAQPPMRFHDFEVTFGPDRLVSGTLTCEASWEPSDGAAESIQAVAHCRRRVGNFILTRPDGSTNILRAAQPGLHLFLLDGDVTDGPRLSPGPNWLVEALPELLRKKTIAGVKHLYIGHRHDGYEELVRTLPTQTARECYVATDPEITLTVWDKDSRLLMYKAGELWSVPGITMRNGDLVSEDHRWLVHRLGDEPAPREAAQ